MNKNFQLEVIKFFVKDKFALNLINDIDGSAVFDFPQYNAVFELLKGYTEKYKVVTELSLLQYLDDVTSKKPIKPASLTKIQNTIKLLFREELKADPVQLRDKVIEYAQEKMSTDLIADLAPRLSEGLETFKELQKGFNRVVGLSETSLLAKENPGIGGGLIAGHKDRDFTPLEMSGQPTKFRRLNSLMNLGGFSSPELVIFVAKAKFGKTAFLMDMAVWYMVSGLQCYYADGENGKDPLLMRYYQALMKLPESDVLKPEHREFMNEQIRWYGMTGGDINMENYPANVATFSDIERDIDKIENDTGIKYNVGVWDYLDLWRSINPKFRGEKRHNIQAVYHDAIRLQTEREMFGISITQIKETAIHKKHYQEGDVEEDKAKSKNCHAMFGLPQTETEEKADVFRCHPIVQRRGKPTGTVYMSKDLSIGAIDELTQEQYEERLEDYI